MYRADAGVGSVGLRPYVVYGPGRDGGLTAAPTLAIAAAARGEAYRVPFGGRCQLQLARDAAATFVAAARSGHDGASVFNLGGPASSMEDLVEAIEAAEPAARGLVTFDDAVQLPFPPELEAGELDEVTGALPPTPLTEGVRETLEHYRSRPGSDSLSSRP